MRRRIHRLAVIFDNDIRSLESRLLRRTILHDVADEHALGLGDPELRGQLRRQVLNRDTKPAAYDLPRPYQLIHDGTRQIARHGKPYPHVAAALAENRRINPNQFAPHIDERAS